MSDIDKLLSKQKISASMSKPENYECFVAGPAVGMSDALVPCVLNSVAGQTAKVLLADGHDTGVEMSVPLASVSMVGAAKMAEAAKDLFKGD